MNALTVILIIWSVNIIYGQFIPPGLNNQGGFQVGFPPNAGPNQGFPPNNQGFPPNGPNILPNAGGFPPNNGPRIFPNGPNNPGLTGGFPRPFRKL